MPPLPWREAMTQALYGPGGFFVSGAGPAAHFRTSAHAGPVFAAALLRLIQRVDTALGSPDRLDVVDVGAGRGELLRTIAGLATPALAERLRLTAVELAPRPPDLPATIGWRDRIPGGITGLLLATEWLDNVPVELAVRVDGGWRTVLVDPATGAETAGGPIGGTDAEWLAAWWLVRPESPPGPARTVVDDAGVPDSAAPAARVEIGRDRDTAWAEAVRGIDRGIAVAVDYGHLRGSRPPFGTLAGYRAGRQVPPVPDGSCDLTAHVAIDAVAAAGQHVAGRPYTLVSQRAALRSLGAGGGRPPLALASVDPAGYVRALAAASTAAELTEPSGLGGHWWLFQPLGIDLDVARWRA